MARLTLKEVEARVEPLADQESYDREFFFDLLAAYGKPKSSITRLRTGSLNVAANPDRELAQKNVLYLREIPDADEGLLLKVGEQLRSAAHVVRFTPRFVIVTDYRQLLAWDTKTNENVIFHLNEISQHFTFFLPWAGMEKTQYVAEAHADVKAAERMGELFDELLKANRVIMKDDSQRHGLNVFFTRLLFCYFAEDTGIFEENQFTNAVGSHTQENGSDVQDFLTDLFLALDTPNPADKPAHLAAFSYVNGRLFSSDQELTVPAFTKKARTMLLSLGKLIWQEINPDIFGSMFQAIVTPGKRSDLGQHYTSVPNILKTIEPLFLNNLRDEFDSAYDNARRLERLLKRIAGIHIFDPACGSGNFLVIAYKELRRLEHAILERLAELDPVHDTLFTHSVINIEHFYGIEIDDFAVEVAILSLWIAKHQMNREFRDKFGVEIPLIPLKECGKITANNAARIDWNQVCPNDGKSEIYLIGNPPYAGFSKQSKEQKKDYPYVFGDRPYSKKLDYIVLWFVKGSDYIQNTRAQLAFVSTNSVSQGEHVALMFPMLFEMGIEIGYAYPSFKWENNARHNAGVSVVVICLRNADNSPKYIYKDDLRTEAKTINGYLVDGPLTFVPKRTKPLAGAFPRMRLGCMALDGGHLLMSRVEYENAIQKDSRVSRFCKKIVGSQEFINGIDRYCLWITESDLSEAQDIPFIADRITKVREFRLKSKDAGTRKKAEVPWSFREQRLGNAIIVPSVSSERREYVPIGYLGADTVISNLAFAIYDAAPWLFALLTSKMHMVWLRAVGGKMKTDFRYSNMIVYNNFPVPLLTKKIKGELSAKAFRVLDVREYHCEYTLAELYDPDKMPVNLRQAHAELDLVVDQVYSKAPFASDEERLSKLFSLYEQMTVQEAEAAEARKATKKIRRNRKVRP